MITESGSGQPVYDVDWDELWRLADKDAMLYGPDWVDQQAAAQLDGLASVNRMTTADAIAWYNRHDIAAYIAHPTFKHLHMLPKGYHFDDLGVLGEQQLARVAEICALQPGLRVAIILGKASGLCAIDVDDLDAWARLRAELGIGDEPVTAWQTTGREGGGLHLLFRRGSVDESLLKQGQLCPGVELKTKGLIIAAPSMHGSGRTYQWQPGPGEPAEISAGLLGARQENEQQIRAEVKALERVVSVAGREQMEAGNPADFADLLCLKTGTGSLTGVYQRDNKLVMVPRFGEEGYTPVADSDEHPEKNPPAQVRALNPNLLQGFVQSRAWTYKLVVAGKHNGEPVFEPVHILPPMASCSAVIHSDPSSWKSAPPLAGVTHIPLLRPDGSLLAEPGYDEPTSLLYLPLPGQDVPRVPDRPSAADVEVAKNVLWNLFSEFEWASPGDFLNYLAALIVPSLRLAVPPPWPPLIINAHDRGSGKTLLSEVIRLLYGGVTYPAPEGDEQELRKLITTVLLSTTGGVVVMDNAMRAVRSKNLASLFTDPSGMWHDRILGGNESPGLPNDRLWVFNGNNIRLGGDLPRRALWSTIDPHVPQPWLRTGFRISDLAGHVGANRAQILAAILTLGRYWALAGKPAGSTARGDTFAPFAARLSGLLEITGLAKPEDFWAEETNRAADGADDEDWAGFLVAIYKAWGPVQWTAGGLVKACTDHSRDQSAEAVREALPGDLLGEVSANRPDAGIARSLGWWLRNHEGQWTSARLAVLCKGGGKNGHPKVWAVEYRP